MKSTYVYTICAIAAQLFTAGIGNAQTTNLQPAPAGIVIDGSAREWGDKLPYANDKAKVTYAISNDKNNLYLVVKTKDQLMQSDILGSGITFTINTKGKKSTAFTLTFPASNNEDPNDYLSLDSAQTQAKTILVKYRKISAAGFKDITDEQLSVSNPYGIQVAASYDNTTGYLTYEEAVPLTLLHADIVAGKEWAFNIQINGLQKKLTVGKRIVIVYGNKNPAQTAGTISNGNGSYGGGNNHTASAMYGGSGGGGSVNVSGGDADNGPKFIQVTPPVDFWVKFNLAKVQ